MLNHPADVMTIDGEDVAVDRKVVPLVYYMNLIEGVRTISSCQGNSGIIGEGGVYGHVAFTVTGEWQSLAKFCFETLRTSLLEFLDDEVRIDIFVMSEEKSYAWISFRSEAVAWLTERMRLLAHA